MIRASAFYPNEAGGRFDFDYYRNVHFPMVMDLLKPFGALRFEVERGLAMSDGAAPEYLAVGSIYFENLEKLQAGLKEHGARVFADVPNYTDLTPRLQFGELL